MSVQVARIARELRIQPDDVLTVLEHPHTSAVRLARSLRIQPEDVSRIRSTFGVAA